MKERPILFSASMVRAILEGSKTQTRRVVKPRKDLNYGCLLQPNELAGEVNAGSYMNCPYGKPGDQLWVRETFAPVSVRSGSSDKPYAYKADLRNGEYYLMVEKWKPSIHMPRKASRIQLEITGVRVERLQNISEQDAVAEGAVFVDFGKDKYKNQLPGWRCDKKPEKWEESLITARHAYGHLWESINGAGSWDANPWVWVIEFRRIKP